MSEQYSCFLHGDHAEEKCPKCDAPLSSNQPCGHTQLYLSQYFGDHEPVTPCLWCIKDHWKAEADRIANDLAKEREQTYRLRAALERIREICRFRSDSTAHEVCQLISGDADETNAEDRKLAASVDAFLEHTEKQGLLNEDQLQAATKATPSVRLRLPDNETLKRQILSDPDDEPSAGNGE